VTGLFTGVKCRKGNKSGSLTRAGVQSKGHRIEFLKDINFLPTPRFSVIISSVLNEGKALNEMHCLTLKFLKIYV
jgi:hypothetical protein